jgi:Fur family peroxide stress response transcriptional regulator
LEAVCKGGHPAAGEIFDRIAQTERISLGTVYRNLMILEEEGEIVQVPGDPELIRYDRRRDLHHHLHCGVCGRIYDMPLPYDSGVDREAARKSGHRIEGHAVTFEGVCKECMKTECMENGSGRERRGVPS